MKNTGNFLSLTSFEVKSFAGKCHLKTGRRQQIGIWRKRKTWLEIQYENQIPQIHSQMYIILLIKETAHH
jgi:hypothetical protein